jgi:hypothetical protein
LGVVDVLNDVHGGDHVELFLLLSLKKLVEGAVQVSQGVELIAKFGLMLDCLSE